LAEVFFSLSCVRSFPLLLSLCVFVSDILIGKVHMVTFATF
jgi:hypothetical protein